MSKISVSKMSLEESKGLGLDIGSWSRWECEPSTFDWYYSDTETAYVFEGDVIVTAGEEEVHITGGVLVRFPAGLECKWEVREKISKVYTFGLE